MDGQDGNRPDNDNRDDAVQRNIVRFPVASGRGSRQKRQEPDNNPERSAPLINLPPATKGMILLFAAIHVGLNFLNPSLRDQAFETFGFIPARYTGGLPFQAWALAAPLTYAFLHGSWGHLGLNSVMMAALGTGAERWLGAKRMIILFLACSVAGALCQFALSPFSPAPVVGASAGISGLFAVVVVMMQRMNAGQAAGRSLVPFILVWIGVSVVSGLIGAPGGGPIAWGAHIGGFLAGFIFLRPLSRRF